MQLNKLAFTLIELLVVIAIIGILSGLIVVSMSGVTQKATIAKAQVFSNSLRNSLMLNLISEWKFDEGSGTSIVDSWSGGNTGTLVNFTFDTTDGWRSGSNCISGACVQFDGSNDYLTFPDKANLDFSSAVSISMWVYITDVNTLWNGILSKGTQLVASPGYRFMYRGDTDKFFLGDSDGTSDYSAYTTNAVGIVPQKWYHIAASLYSTGRRVYLNGNLVQAWTDASHSIYNNAYDLCVGCLSAGTYGNSFYGTIDEVRIYDSVIPISQIQEQYFFGLNNLLISGAITQEEYLSRFNNYAVK